MSGNVVLWSNQFDIRIAVPMFYLKLNIYIYTIQILSLAGAGYTVPRPGAGLARGTLGPDISARGPKAPEACLCAFRFPLPEFRLSEFHLFFRQLIFR